jgi:hypothetical protein
VAPFERHFSYDQKSLLWISLHNNSWFVGTAILNCSVNSAARQVSSRLGASASLPLSQQAINEIQLQQRHPYSVGGNYPKCCLRLAVLLDVVPVIAINNPMDRNRDQKTSGILAELSMSTDRGRRKSFRR